MKPYQKKLNHIHVYFTKLPKNFCLQKLNFTNRRFEHVVGRELLKTVIEDTTGINKREIFFIETEYGKPYVDFEEGISIKFNLSHTNDLIIATFSENSEVGIDIEDRNKDFLDIMPEVFTYKEIEMINQCGKKDRLNNFYVIWTRKEAITKAMGLGLNYEFKNIEFDNLILNKIDTVLGWWYYTFSLGSNYIVSIAREEMFHKPTIHEIPIETLLN